MTTWFRARFGSGCTLAVSTGRTLGIRVVPGRVIPSEAAVGGHFASSTDATGDNRFRFEWSLEVAAAEESNLTSSEVHLLLPVAPGLQRNSASVAPAELSRWSALDTVIGPPSTSGVLISIDSTAEVGASSDSPVPAGSANTPAAPFTTSGVSLQGAHLDQSRCF